MKKFRNTEEPKINNDSSDHRWRNGAGPGGERLQTQKNDSNIHWPNEELRMSG